jgi:YVTN family beta-propeller protein
VSGAVSRDGTAAYVANAGSGNLSVIDTRASRAVRTLPPGPNPVGVTVAPNGRTAYVANEARATVTAVATRTGRITATVPVGEGPFDVALAPDGGMAYVAVLGPGNMSAISTQTHRISGTVNVGPPGTDPFNIAVTPTVVYRLGPAPSRAAPSMTGCHQAEMKARISSGPEVRRDRKSGRGAVAELAVSRLPRASTGLTGAGMALPWPCHSNSTVRVCRANAAATTWKAPGRSRS